MSLYRVVYTYDALQYGERAGVTYIHADSQKEAEDNFKRDYPNWVIENIRKDI